MHTRHYLFPVLAAALALAACAHPQPGPNAQADAGQAPSNTPLAREPSTGAELGAVVNDHIDVLFADGSATLGPDAGKQLDLAARLFRDAGPSLMFSAGCSSATGDEYTNLLLSARRAQVVKEALAARGIPASRVLIRAYGASDPANSSNPSDPSNRRVVITWRLA